ncbi:Wzz/FepE/Etk N-terminal domain-containing protein [Nocardiopsis aegyptia]|uniref:Capsular polysaccharide biosynthesis protein/Mrp family chromosome partitioning ATPase n=1 Tax=Nocardiopsis aegyptia TaxID=220378 RepID=A0A7Z0JBE7_9ACTN|nr:Wzz/FepE/Etk N-terminal domain-containing protein [Nocardiopsis aegyptia]NYJ36258.1 capsular polysaccharide biosynthesis protein/Mrp family chromosome partitioning ATPase [Nocardiopsis aegyptia]
MDTETPGSSGPELREYTALLRRRLRLVVAGVLGGLVLATAAVLTVPPSYTSTAAVQVRPTGVAELTGERSGRVAGDVNLDTEAQVVLSDQVATQAADTLAESGAAVPDTQDLRERVEVTVPPNSNVLEIHYTADSAEGARAGADAYALAYLDRREAQVRELVGSQLDALRAEQETRYEALAELAAESAGATGTARAGADARAEALRAEIAELGNGISPLGALQETIVPGQVITPASTPEGPASPIPALWLLGGAALGLLAGLLAAVARDRLDPRLRDTEETPRLSGVPVLLDLSGGRGSERAVGLLGDHEADGQRVNEVAHLIRTRLAPVAGVESAATEPVSAETASGETAPGMAESDEPAPGRILFTAATTPGRAGAVAAVNLAAALARTGAQTLLVCVDPRTAPIDALLGLADGPGLAEALVEGEDPAELTVRPDAAPLLRVLRHGSADLDAPVRGTAMEDLLHLLRSAAEYVVVALPAASERADAHALAGTADLLLPVVELGRTPRAALTGLVGTADRFGTTVPGTLVLPRQPRAEDSVPATGRSADSRATASDRSAGADRVPATASGAPDGRTATPKNAERSASAGKVGKPEKAEKADRTGKTAATGRDERVAADAEAGRR